MAQKDYFQKLFTGNKPTSNILETAEEEMKKFNVPLGEVVQIGKEEIFINTVGDAMNVKTHLAALPITHAILQKKNLQDKDIETFNKVKQLILYWFAKRWIGPLPDFGKPMKPSNGENFYLRGNYKKQYLEGAEPDQETLEMIRSYLDFTMMQMSFSGGSGPFMMTNIHGVGPVSGKVSPVQRFFQLTQAGGAKMAKDCFNLEVLDNKNEIQKLYLDCHHILLFWTMKWWLKLPDLEGKNPFR